MNRQAEEQALKDREDSIQDQDLSEEQEQYYDLFEQKFDEILGV